MRATPVGCGYRHKGKDDFALFHVDTDKKFPYRAYRFKDPQVLDQVVNVASPLGLGKQVMLGNISSNILNRPVISKDINWGKGVAAPDVRSGRRLEWVKPRMCRPKGDMWIYRWFGRQIQYDGNASKPIREIPRAIERGKISLVDCGPGRSSDSEREKVTNRRPDCPCPPDCKSAWIRRRAGVRSGGAGKRLESLGD